MKWHHQVSLEPSLGAISDITGRRQLSNDSWPWTALKLTGENHAEDSLRKEYYVLQREIASYPGWRLV